MITATITRTQEQHLNMYVSNHIQACEAFMEYENDNLLGGFEPFAPYCGCSDCLQRETLHAAFKWLEDNGVLRLEADDSN